MNYEKIKNDLITEVRLTKNQAEVFLLVVTKGKMPASQIAKLADLTVDEATAISQKLVELGGLGKNIPKGMKHTRNENNKNTVSCQNLVFPN